MVAIRISNLLNALGATRARAAPQTYRCTFVTTPRFYAGGGSTKAVFSENMKKAASPEDASAESGGSRSKEATETGSSPTGGSVGGAPKDTSTASVASRNGGEALKGPQGKGAPSPKIHNQSVPGAKQGLSDEQKREVEEHNREFEKRYDRGSEAPDDKVDKKYWSGNGGVKQGQQQGRTGNETDWNA